MEAERLPNPELLPEEKTTEKSLETEQLRDFLYAKAINPDTPPEEKTLLNWQEIRSASPERLQQLQDLISGKTESPDNIIPFPKK